MLANGANRLKLETGQQWLRQVQPLTVLDARICQPIADCQALEVDFLMGGGILVVLEHCV